MVKFKFLFIFIFLSSSLCGQTLEPPFGWDLTYRSLLARNNVGTQEVIRPWLEGSTSPADAWVAELKAKPADSAILIEFPAFHAGERTTILLHRTGTEAFYWDFVEGGKQGRNEEPIKVQYFDVIFNQVSTWKQLPPKRADQLPDQAFPGYMGFLSFFDTKGSSQILLTMDDFFICPNRKCEPGKQNIGRVMAALAPILIREEEKNYKHKTESEIAKMTVEERIREQIREHEHLTSTGDEHDVVIRKYLQRDGAKTFPYLIGLMDGYNPRRHRDSGPSVATQIAVQIDEGVARLRASGEGRQVIEAMKRLHARMRTEGGYSSGLDLDLRSVTGTNFKDQAIADGLWLSYRVNMTEGELLDFVNYLIKVAPDYPSWSETEWKMDLKRNKTSAFPHTQGAVVGNPSRYYKSYLDFKRSIRNLKSSN